MNVKSTYQSESSLCLGDLFVILSEDLNLNPVDLR